jgi:D-amino peptidase
MKIYISADIEGVSGIDHWDEATLGKTNYDIFREQMVREVTTACEAAIAAGATEIVVKDAHDSGRNLIPERLPHPVQLIRGWSGHPYSMVQELDSSFDALILIGYHAPAGSGANPLAHTLTTSLAQVRLNGQPIAEFHLMTLTAASEGVPVVFVSGDAMLCSQVKAYDPQIETVATKKGWGESVLSIHPEEAIHRIRAGVEQALLNRGHISVKPLPAQFELAIEYKHPPKAYRSSFYPGAELQDDRTVVLKTNHWFDVMRALQFIIRG